MIIYLAPFNNITMVLVGCWVFGLFNLWQHCDAATKIKSYERLEKHSKRVCFTIVLEATSRQWQATFLFFSPYQERPRRKVRRRSQGKEVVHRAQFWRTSPERG